jgi:hypothetical protein
MSPLSPSASMTCSWTCFTCLIIKDKKLLLVLKNVARTDSLALGFNVKTIFGSREEEVGAP